MKILVNAIDHVDSEDKNAKILVTVANGAQTHVLMTKDTKRSLVRLRNVVSKKNLYKQPNVNDTNLL